MSVQRISAEEAVRNSLAISNSRFATGYSLSTSPFGAALASMPHMTVAQTQIPDPPPIIDYVAANDLVGTPPAREWLVQGIILMNTVTLLYGDGGTGKSLLGLQLAVSMALSRLWLNQLPIGGNTLYFSAEDDRNELHRRLADITAFHGVSTAWIPQITIADMAGKDAILGTDMRGKFRQTAIYNNLIEKVAAIKPRLVVIDTLADAFGGNENDRSQSRQFVGLMRRIAIEHHCAVLLLAHPSLTGISSGTGASGSTAWNNSVRSRLYFERIKEDGYEGNPDARRLTVMKSNYGRIGTEIQVTWRDGVFIAQQESSAPDANLKAERVFLALLDRTTAEGRTFGPTHAPKRFSDLPEKEGLTLRALKDAMERLFLNKKIRTQIVRENGKDRTIIVRTAN